MEILVLHPGALGDIILSLPALMALRQQFPNPRITFAGNTDYLPYSGWGHADRIVSLAALPLHNFYTGGRLQAEEAEWWKSFDLLISWTGAGNAEFESNLTALQKPVIVAGWRPKPRELRHVSRIFADSLRPWLPPQERIPAACISIPEEAVSEARVWLERQTGLPIKPLLAIHPGASSSEKRWPLERFRSIAKLFEPTHNLLIIEGPAEAGLAVELARGLLNERHVIAASLPLRLLAAALSCCEAYLGSDSGISHLAAALGLRSVVIFGPTPPEQWSPSGHSVTVLRDTSSCAACDRSQPEGHSCLGNITVDKVRDCLIGRRRS